MLRADDGVAMVLDAVHRRLPLAAMRCAHDPQHLATVWCSVCVKMVCDACRAREHVGHATQPYRWVDWSIRPPQSLLGKLRELVSDATDALRAAPRHDGVVLGDDDRDDDEDGAPVYRRVRARPPQ